MPRTPDELQKALQEQIGFMRKSNAAFDAGDTAEAKRLATTVHVLVHDKGRTTSLLTQMGVLNQANYLASAPPINPRNLLSSMQLIRTRVTGDARTTKYEPIFGDCPVPGEWLPFAEWWNQPVFKDQRGLTLSRKELVLTLRDQEGGGHFDAELTNPAYISVTAGMGWYLRTPDGDRSIDPGPQFAAMRQIAWELEQSLAPAKII